MVFISKASCTGMICLKNNVKVSSVSINDRAFQYGDGCFTTARVVKNQIELWQRHLKRLNDAIATLHLDVSLNMIQDSLNVLIQQYGELNGTLKIIISRGEGERGYRLPDHQADLYVIYLPHAVHPYHPETISSGLLLTPIGLLMPNLVGIKTLNRLEQVILKKEADENNWVEALVSDVQGGVVEGVSSNCFIRINNAWITPELRYNGVHGVMRAEILTRMQQAHLSCEIRYIDFDEISQIQSLFFCNALSPMKMVHQFNDTLLDVQPCVELFHSLHLNQI